MTVIAVLVGLGLVGVALVDLVWTTIAAGSGAGPVTRRLARSAWQAALAVHRRRPSHRFLTAAGVGVVVVVLLTWIATVVAGWSLVFLSSGSAVLTSTGEPADALDRLYFTGYTVFTPGNGEFRPTTGPWQLATVAATGTGLVLITLAIPGAGGLGCGRAPPAGHQHLGAR